MKNNEYVVEQNVLNLVKRNSGRRDMTHNEYVVGKMDEWPTKTNPNYRLTFLKASAVRIKPVGDDYSMIEPIYSVQGELNEEEIDNLVTNTGDTVFSESRWSYLRESNSQLPSSKSV